VLIDAASGGLRVFWQVSGDDLLPAVAGFRAADAGVPEPVLRLRRLDGPRAGLVSEVRLLLPGPSGHGNQGFEVEVEPARYQVELGISDGARGWLMLARSNALDLGAHVGLRLAPRLPIPATPRRQDELPGQLMVRHRPDAVPASSDTQSGLRERRAAPTWLSSSGSESIVGSAPGAPSCPDPTECGRGAVETDRVTRDAGGDADVLEQMQRPLTAPLETPALVGGLSPLDVPADVVAAPQDPEGAAPTPGEGPLSSRELPSPTAPMVYGRGVPRLGEPIIEAELRVNGCAAPGTEIDLFGVPFRVGSGGRFQVSIRVDDTALIRRAFELNPPALARRDPNE
jgi:hypothetical protein